jgi:hypothetical protein
MNTVETKVRTALEQTAREISPRDVPELRLPEPADGRHAARLLDARRWPGWTTPLLAAAVVVAVIAVSLAVPRAVLTGHAGHRGASSQAAAVASIPAYYVMLSFANPRLRQNGAAQVRASATGQVLSTVQPPAHGTFTAVTAAANDSTFVLAARVRTEVKNNNSRVTALMPSKLRFYQLSLTPSSRDPLIAPRASLNSVPLRVTQAATLTGLALTPDASKLAVSLTVHYRSVINVVSMVTGKARTWSGVTPGGSRAGPGGNMVSGLSWAADDRTLAYNNLFDVRLLDTEAPGNSLALDSANGMAATHNGLRVPMSCFSLHAGYPHGYWGNALLTPDASLVIASGGYQNGKAIAVTVPRERWQTGRMTYPCSDSAWWELAAKWRPARYGTLTGAVRWIYWAGPSGRTLIVHAYFGMGGRGVNGVLDGTRFTPLPGAGDLSADPGAAISSVAW